MAGSLVVLMGTMTCDPDVQFRGGVALECTGCVAAFPLSEEAVASAVLRCSSEPVSGH